MPTEIDTRNEFWVGGNGDNVAVLKPIVGYLSPTQAIGLAARLVSMAGVAMAFDDGPDGALLQFNATLEAIRAT